jgi:hypothetical protein
MSNSGFLSFLVDETFKLQSSGEIHLSSLEQKLRDYELSFLKGEFLPQTQLLRFQTPFGPMDIPVNWSVFALEDHQFNNIILNTENDVDSLFTVIQAAWSNQLKQILITHADGFCYMVGLKAGDESHLHDLLNPQVLLRSA